MRESDRETPTDRQTDSEPQQEKREGDVVPADEFAACPPTCPAPNPKAMKDGFDEAIFGTFPSPTPPTPPMLAPEEGIPAAPRGSGIFGFEDTDGTASSNPESGPGHIGLKIGFSVTSGIEDLSSVLWSA